MRKVAGLRISGGSSVGDQDGECPLFRFLFRFFRPRIPNHKLDRFIGNNDMCSVHSLAVCVLTATSICGCKAEENKAHQKTRNTVSESPEEALNKLMDIVRASNRIEFELIDEGPRIGPVVITDTVTVKEISSEIERLANPKINQYPFTNVLSGDSARITFICTGRFNAARIRFVGWEGVMFPEDERFEAWLPDYNCWKKLVDLAEAHAKEHPEDAILR